MRRLIPRFVLFLLLLAAGAPSAWAQAQGRREMVARQREQMEAAFASMPKLRQTSVKDVFTLRMQDKNLVCECPLLEAPSVQQGQMRAEIQGIDGLTSVQVSKIALGGREGPRELRNFVLTTYDYSDPEVITTVTVQSQPYYFHIERQSQLPDGYRSIRLMQHGPSAGPERNGQVQFTVIHTTNGGALPVSITLEAPDFYTLLRRYPQETDEHLRPIFRRVGQEAVFAPDPLIAWQVFADQWQADEHYGRRVRDLLPELDHADFRARDAASKGLEEMGRGGAAVLLHLDRSALSPEQNMRLDRALAPYAQLPTKEARRLAADPGFLLDCLYGEDPAIRAAALEQLRQVTGRAIHIDADADPLTRSAAVAALRKELAASPQP